MSVMAMLHPFTKGTLPRTPRYKMFGAGGARMKMPRPLLVASVIALLSISLPAQERLPDAYLEKLATIDHLQRLTSSELAVLHLVHYRAQPRHSISWHSSTEQVESCRKTRSARTLNDEISGARIPACKGNDRLHVSEQSHHWPRLKIC